MPTVLIVDDSPTEVHILRQGLEKAGFDILVANSGEEGIEVAKENKPDAIIMDVVMPELNGFQATRKITKDPATQHIPVILVTTKDQETDKVWGERQGAAGYIVKPAQEPELAAMIKRVLG